MAAAYSDHHMVVLAERIADHLPEPPPGTPRQRLWRVRAQQVVLASGALERPIAFADNDRPGVMLASAARAYVNQYAVRPGTRAVVLTNNDSAYAAARDLVAAGVEVAAVVDVREATRQSPPPGARHLMGHAVVQAHGRLAVHGAQIAPLADRDGPGEYLSCDLICVSGGWNPSVHLHAQARGRPAYDPALAAFVPGEPFQRERSAGAAKGSFTLQACLAEGFAAGSAAARAAGFAAKDIGSPPSAGGEDDPTPIRACWSLPPPPGRKPKRFVDHQNDVTADDVALAAREGYDHVELLKRYTTLGMGTDQGRTSNVAGLALLAGIRGREIPAVGTTTFRPPFAPVTTGAFAGREIGAHHPPVRRTPLHDWHEEAGARFVNAGLWKRPAWYPGAGEGMWDAIFREARSVRQSVGMVDVSTLGKIDLQGPDAAEFLNRVYVNRFDNLAVGRCRYGLMLRDDGIVLDDGTTSRLDSDHFLMTTTTAKSAHVVRQLEFLLQVVWPDLDVHLVQVTEDWAQVALAGPRSREVLARVTDLDVSDAALPFMAARACTLAGVPSRVFRISFSGELAYELAVPADYGPHLWQALLEAGRPFDLAPYGTEAMNILRIEKGHVTGGEINGRTTADDLGFGRMLRADKSCVGKRSLRRPGLARENRRQLVGLRGAQLVADPARAAPNPVEGEVTSTCRSPNLERPIALGLLERGRARIGERLFAASPLRSETVEVEVAAPVFFDPAGERLRG
jgi:sarcosine oxidase subunit alpha